MTELFNTLEAGAQTPFEILHISDTHLTLADRRDTERKNMLARRRVKGFPDACENAEAAVKYASEKNITVMNTGDLTDFVSYANNDRVKELMSRADIFTCAGNHEFSLYVGEAWEDGAYRNQSLAFVQSSYPNDIRFSSRIINGVNFVAVDNSYYLFEKEQLEGLKKEVSKGLPVVLMLHVPLYAPDIYDYQINTLGNTDAALMNVPEEKMSFYSEHRFRQQKSDETTAESYDYIVNEKAIRFILTGHLHYDFESHINGRLTQYVTGISTLRHIVIK